MDEMPHEFLSALEKDPAAMQRFAGLPDAQKDAVLRGARNAHSAQEMLRIVSRL